LYNKEDLLSAEYDIKKLIEGYKDKEAARKALMQRYLNGVKFLI